jgi:hypothetical protein
MSFFLKQADIITESLVNKIDGIDLIYLFGGIAHGREHPRSDIEMVAVSNGKFVRWEFILDDRPIFIWPQSWKQLKNISNGKSDYWCVAGASIAHAKILWCISDEKKEKFKKIQEKTKLGAKMALKRSIDSFDKLYGKLWRIQKAIEIGREIDTNFLIWDLIKEITNIIATLNDRFLLNNWGKQCQELQAFKILPSNFIIRYNALIKSKPKEALQIASDLVDDVNKLLKNWISATKATFKEDLEEIVTDWPTVLEFYNKAVTATEQGDLSAGLYAASDNAWFNLWAFTTLRKIKWDKRSFFSASNEIKNLPSDIKNNLSLLLESKNLEVIQKATNHLVEDLRNELEKDGWTIPVCTTIEDAYKFLKIY